MEDIQDQLLKHQSIIKILSRYQARDEWTNEWVIVDRYARPDDISSCE